MKILHLTKYFFVIVLAAFDVVCGYQNIENEVNKSFVLLPGKINSGKGDGKYEINMKVKSFLYDLKGKSTGNVSLVLTFEQTCNVFTSQTDLNRINNDTENYNIELQGNFSFILTSTCNSTPINLPLSNSISTFQENSKQKGICIMKQHFPLHVNLRLLLKEEACSEDESSVFILELQDELIKSGSLQKADLKLDIKDTACDFDGECEWHYNKSTLVSSMAGVRQCWKSDIPNLKQWLKSNTKLECNKFPEKSAQGQYFGLFLPTKKVRSTTVTSQYIMGSSQGCTLELSMWFFKGKVEIIFKTEKLTTTLDSITTYVKNGWQRVSIPIGKVDQPFVLEIVMTLPLKSNGAFDDVRLVNCATPKEDEPVPSCHSDEFQCSTDICIPRARVCDLVPDCLFGEDESDELCGTIPDNARCSFENGTCGWTNVVGNGSSCAFHVVSISDVIRRKTYEDYQGSALTIQSSDCKDGDQVLFDSEVFQPYIAQNHSCQFRFSIYINTPRSPSFSVSIIYEKNENNMDWHDITNIKQRTWNKYHIDLPPTTKSFQIGLVVDYINNQQDRYLSDILVDNLSLSPECFAQAPVLGHVLEKEEEEKNSTLLIALLGAIIGTVVFLVTALVIVTIYRKKSSTGRILEKPYRKISTHSSSTSSTTTSSLDDKTGFLDEALLDNDDRQLSIGRSVCHSDRQLSLNGSVCNGDRHPSLSSSLCAMTISPYYEWIHEEEMIRNIPRTKIKLLRMIGKGAFGEVYYGLLADVAHLRKDLPVAIKTLPSLCSEQTKSEFFFEALILSKFKHPNITRFLGISVDDRSMLLILELMEGGDVRTFVRDERPREKDKSSNLTMKDLLKLATDIAKGCQYLECNKFIHRDIAARNCLLTEKGPNRVAKIGDFGMARDIFRTNYYRKNGIAMIPVKWMPSEAFMDGVFTSKTDVWAFGVVLWEIFTMGYLPYPGKSNNEVMKYVTSGGRLNQPPLASNEIFKLMTECWKKEPSDRPLFSVIVDSLNKINQNVKGNNKITLNDISKPVPPPPQEVPDNDQDSKQETHDLHRPKRHHKHSHHSVTKATVKTCEVPV